MAALLATRLGLQPVVLDEENADSVAARALSEHRGGVVLIIAHDSSVVPLVQALSGLAPPVPHEGESPLFVVSVPTYGSAGLLQLSY
jgi:hypothetical protein